jgi:vacuolar-type H+-ATPase subunit I/STV1
MAASDELTKLAARAKQAEDRVAAARAKAKDDLEHDVELSAADAKATAEKLRQTAQAGKGKVSVWWDNAQRTWNEHIATIRENIEARRAEHDQDKAELRADIAEDDALFAIDYAYAAIEEAEYAVLDASLARVEADELAAVPH